MTVRVEELLCVVRVTADLAAPLVRARDAGASADEPTASTTGGSAEATPGETLADAIASASSTAGSGAAAGGSARPANEPAAAAEIADRVYRLMRRDLELARERE